MKITIEHSKTKRQVDGPFRVCISREAAISMMECLAAAFTISHDEVVMPSSDNCKNSVSDTWVEIHDRAPQIASGPPRGWDE